MSDVTSHHRKLTTVRSWLVCPTGIRVITSIGVWARGAWGGSLPPSKFGQLRFFGQQDKFGQSQFLKRFAYLCAYCFFSKRDIFYFKLK